MSRNKTTAELNELHRKPKRGDRNAQNRRRYARQKQARDIVKAAKAEAQAKEDAKRVPRPVMGSEMAAQFVRLLSSGIPAMDCLRYLAPEHYAGLDDEQRAVWLSDWSADKTVVRALSRFNGGQWEKLDKDDRLQLALDKALASLAYFLYTHEYAQCEGSDLKKHDAARKDLMEYLKSRGTGDEDTPWMRALRNLVEGKAELSHPPQLEAIPIEILDTVGMRES